VKVLVADDSVMYREVLKGLLSSWHYEVVLASDGEEAMAVLNEENAPHLLLLDSMMPGLSGPELCQAVRNKQQDYTYIILLSSRGDEEDVAHGFEVGADDYLCKPFREFELRARLRAGERIIRTHEELMRAKEALQFQATHDHVTQLPNRRGIIETLHRELNRATRTSEPLTVCMADLDNFKRVNDTWGHMVGDDVLRWVAEQMPGALRKYDSVGRYGGEEFLIVLPGCNCKCGMEVGERLRQRMAGSLFTAATAQFSVTMSLGICQLLPGMKMEELLNGADQALYRAKKLGRNRVEAAAVTASGIRVDADPSIFEYLAK
jgi:two-component system, cell cycle response regulator